MWQTGKQETVDIETKFERGDSIVDVVKKRLSTVNPYENAIKMFRKMPQLTSPSQKLECLIKTFNLIS